MTNKSTSLSTHVVVLAVMTLTVLRPGFAGVSGNRPIRQERPTQFSDAERKRGYVVFVHPTSDRMVPEHVPAQDAIVDRVACELARNERESIQIGLYPLVDSLKDIRIDVDIDLNVTVNYLLPKDTIPGKEWFQAGFFAAHGTLMNEDVAPVLKRGNVQGFWLTFHAKENTPAGLHRGKISVQPAGQDPVSLDLEVNVHPFALPVARAAFGMYFPTDYWLPPYSRSDQWMKAIYEDMAAHSQTSVTFYYGGIDFKADPLSGATIQKQLPMAKAAGLIHPHVPCMLLGSGNIDELAPHEQRAGLERFAKAREDHGWPELLNYGRDEPSYPHAGLRETYASFRSVPMRLVTAVGALPVYGYGDVHDVWVVNAGHITTEMKEEANRLGAEVWSYSCHMMGGRPPKRHRYYAGFYSWAWDIGGNFEWAYHWIAWWTQTDTKPRSTLSWVARRDGVDDFRYLQLLEETLVAKPEHPLATEATSWLTVLRTRIKNGPDPHFVAPSDIHDVCVADPRGPEVVLDFNGVRARAADYIARIGAAPATAPGVTSVVGLKDEAALFREKSIEACVTGLGDSDMSTRRAAAIALFERGPAAAKATGALISSLDDPDVRIPAIRALEAVGPQAVPALPALATLMSHHDGFVRLCAAMAVKTIAIPDEINDETLQNSSLRAAVEILSPALGDDYTPLREVASEGLSRCGAAAAPAVLAAIKVLKQPNYLHWDVALSTLTAIGPEAAPAAPFLAECYKGRVAGWAQTPRKEALALAVIGPGASHAVPTLEKFASDPNHKHREYAYYALYNIRGDRADLDQLVMMMEADEGKRSTIAEFLLALGVKAKIVAPRIRQMLAKETDEDLQKKLQSFLDKVEKGAGPTPILL